MSHHYPGPDFKFPNGDPRLNFTDLFLFPKNGDNSKSILILNSHPSDSLNPPGKTMAEPFSTTALYEFMIDTDNDNVVDIAYSVRFAGDGGGAKTATVRRITGTSTNRTGNDGEVVIEAAPVSTGSEPKVTNSGDYRLFAGWRSDPFFFDTLGALNNLKFTGTDFFAKKNICSIVMEVPNSKLGSNLRVWGRTVDGSSGNWVQTDRGARASQEPFLAADQKIAYLAAEPANDGQFIPVFAHGLQHVGGYTPEQATRVAGLMLPDVQTYQPGRPAKYPDNGRALTDDASAHFLALLTNGKITEDGVHPHTDLLADFPYLGPPHAA